MEGVPTRTRYIRPMKLRPTLHDARVDRGGPVRALSSPAAHLAQKPHTPSVHASLGNQFRFVPIQHAPPLPTPNPHHQKKNMMHQTLTQSRGRDNGRLAWLAMPCTGTGTQARARARAGGHGQLRSCWCCSLQEHDGWCESARCLIAHQTHHSDATAISQTWDETNIWPFLTAQTPLASRHHTLDGKESSTPCHTDLLLLQDTAMGSSRPLDASLRQWEGGWLGTRGAGQLKNQHCYLCFTGISSTISTYLLTSQSPCLCQGSSRHYDSELSGRLQKDSNGMMRQA